jgi:hypothetical protein
MKKYAAVLYVFFTLCLSGFADMIVEPNSAPGETGRFALIIGNSQYPANLLRTPARDTEDIAALLTGLGYQVTLRLDADLAAITQALDEFAALLSGNPGSEGFFWFAGQGAEINGENYLLPVDVNPDTDIAAASYKVNALFYRLNQAKNKVNVVMLDACFTRISPTETHRGFEAVFVKPGSCGIEEMSGDIFYMQSAWPGQIALDSIGGGRNSPFAASFLELAAHDEPLALLAPDIIRGTVTKTLGRQKPYCLSYLLQNKSYALYRGITR